MVVSFACCGTPPQQASTLTGISIFNSDSLSHRRQVVANARFEAEFEFKELFTAPQRTVPASIDVVRDLDSERPSTTARNASNDSPR